MEGTPILYPPLRDTLLTLDLSVLLPLFGRADEVIE